MADRPKGKHTKGHRGKPSSLVEQILFAMEESLEAIAASQLVSQKHLATISRKLSTLMTKADDLNAKVDELQATVDSTQERVAAHLAALQQTIQELTDQINSPGDGITGAEADALLVKLQAAKDDLESTDQPTP